jgi:hypothetical protein
MPRALKPVSAPGKRNLEDGMPVRPSLREVNLSVPSNAKFDDIVAKLKLVLTLPKGINGGCDPCLSGLDKFVVTNEKIIQG